jgi:drug/metabolite transporter (DMT)-like permease
VNRVVEAPPTSPASSLAMWSALSTVYLIWGSTYLAIRFTVETVPPFLSAAARFVTSGVFLYLWRRWAGDPTPDGAEWRSAAIIGTLLLVGGNGGVVWAAQFIPSSLAALLVATVPLWMVVIDALRPGGGWPHRTAILGIALGFCGATLLIGWNTHAPDPAYFHGTLAVVVASFLWALGSIYAKTARLPRSPLMVTGMEMLVGGTAQIIPAWATGEFAALTIDSISLRSALSWIYLTVVGPIAFGAYAWLLRNAPIPLVATYSYVNPLVAIWLGYFIGRETITLRILSGAALIIGSVALVSRGK